MVVNSLRFIEFPGNGTKQVDLPGFKLVISRSQVNILKVEAWIEKPRKECHHPIVGIRLLNRPCSGKLNPGEVLGSTPVQ